MLNQSVREALEAELEHLEAERKQLSGLIDAKIAAIKEILRLDSDIGIHQPTLPIIGVPPKEGTVPTGGNGSLAGKGLREAMKIILSTYPSGLRPVELAAKLEERGYQPGGKTPTKTLVYGEIHRLFSKRKLLRRGRGKYRLPPQAEVHGIEP